MPIEKGVQANLKKTLVDLIMSATKFPIKYDIVV